MRLVSMLFRLGTLACTAIVVPTLWRAYRSGRVARTMFAQQAWLWAYFVLVALSAFGPPDHGVHWFLLGVQIVCLAVLVRTMSRMWPDIAGTGGYGASRHESGGRHDLGL